jgi:hypothetical protein
MLNYYDVLGVESDAPRDEIRAAYRILVARAHPDVNASTDAERETALLNEAWSVLREPEIRAAYDAASLTTSAPLRCQRCAYATPHLRFVDLARARGENLPRHDGAMLCPRCRAREGRAAAIASLVRGGYLVGRDRRMAFAAIARDLRGGKVDARTSAALLRQIGFSYAGKNRSSEALAALEAVLEFGPDAAASRIIARLRETGATAVTPPPNPSRVLRRDWQRRGAIFATAAVLLVALVAGWFSGLGHRAGPELAARNPAVAARNVDPSLRDDVTRLASVVRTRAVAPNRAVYLFDLANDEAFSLAYEAAVVTLPSKVRSDNPWLVTLETTSQPSDAVEVPRSGSYVLARGCAPGKCNDGFVSIAYNLATHAVAGAAYIDSRWHTFGSLDPADRAMLVLAVARNRLPFARRFTLDATRESQLRGYIDEIQS